MTCVTLKFGKSGRRDDDAPTQHAAGWQDLKNVVVVDAGVGLSIEMNGGPLTPRLRDRLDGRVGKVEHRAPLLVEGVAKTSNKILACDRAELLVAIKELKR